MSTRQITMPQLMTELSYLLGEVSVPTSGVDSRKTFLQRALEDAWKVYPWPFSLTDTTITFVDGVATLPDDFLPEGHYYLTKGLTALTETEYNQRNIIADISYYTRFQSGTYQAVLINSTDFVGDLRYQYNVPDLTTSDTKKAFYTNPKTIALGAMPQVTKADNPEADNSQDIAIFQSALQEDYSAFNRIRTRGKRAHSITERSGHSTGSY